MVRGFTVTLATLAGLALMVAPGVASADIVAGGFSPGDVVINEVMPNPTHVFDSRGEWFEVYNAASDNVNLNGLELADDDFDSHFVNMDVIIAPGEFAILVRNDDPGQNGGLPPAAYQYANFFLGNRGDEVLREDSGPGSDFLAGVTVEWEAATRPASDAGVRVVNIRSGLVLDPAGGPLKKMLPAFRLGAGGRLGDGRHYVSWMTLNDAVRAVHHILNTDALVGPTNIATPNPVTNAQFTKALGRAVSRPTIFPAPRFMLRLMFGEIADTLLASARLQPTKLLESGFEFHQPELGDALREMLGK